MTIDISLNPDQNFKHKGSFTNAQSLSSNYYRCFQNYYHGHNYLNPNPKYITNIKCNVNHWQLRDLLKVNQSNGDIYFTKSYSLWKLQQFNDFNKKLSSKEVLRPDYTPKCFDITNDGMAVAGGLMTSAYKIFYSNIEGLSLSGNNRNSRPQKGLFTFSNNELGINKTVKIGEMINNSVSVYPYQTNHYKSYICNNDSSLYCIDILNNDNLSISNKIVCDHDTSLNNVAKSPHNDKLLIVTGDSPSIYLVDPTQKTSKISSIKTNNDSGFGISYHPNGNLFSTAFQNGNCLIYDLRNLNQPLKSIKSTRPGHQSGAFRCCKFSNNSFSDLLVISEHVGRVHLIDLRNLSEENHQVIVFPFALDQFGDYKSGKLYKNNEEDEHQQHEEQNQIDTNDPYSLTKHNEALHQNLEIYEDYTNIKFNAPLVYDYDYLTNVNPKLFKYYSYHPPTTTAPASATSSSDTANHCVSENDEGVVVDELCLNSNFQDSYIMPLIDYNISPTESPVLPSELFDSPLGPFPGSLPSSAPHSASNSIDFRDSYSTDSYQHADNHIYGEMELSGVDWYDSKLLIGCENGGIFSWDVNYSARRSFGSFSFA